MELHFIAFICSRYYKKEILIMILLLPSYKRMPLYSRPAASGRPIEKEYSVKNGPNLHAFTVQNIPKKRNGRSCVFDVKEKLLWH